MNDIRVIRGGDGKVLGVSCRDGTKLDRRDYESYQEFCEYAAQIAFTRIDSDDQSEFAKKLIADDQDRLREMSVIP